ncbi:MAG: response regulator [Spirochaetia bacterium]|nr:response regulator [Spirochaetia bacterium]
MNKLKILVADDNDVNQLLMSKMLQKMGHDVDLVENGQKAVEAASKKNYDIIFMDIQMPVMNGIDATKIILETVVPKPVIVAVTANVFDEDKIKCINAGMKDHIGKPFKMEDLQNAINSYVLQG